jgi:hypothetical protein
VAAGVFAALTISVAASFFSGLDVCRSLLPVLVVAACIPGAVHGFVQGCQNHTLARRERQGGTGNGTSSHMVSPSSRARLNLIFLGHPSGGNRPTGSASGCH